MGEVVGEGPVVRQRVATDSVTQVVITTPVVLNAIRRRDVPRSLGELEIETS